MQIIRKLSLNRLFKWLNTAIFVLILGFCLVFLLGVLLSSGTYNVGKGLGLLMLAMIPMSAYLTCMFVALKNWNRHPGISALCLGIVVVANLLVSVGTDEHAETIGRITIFWRDIDMGDREAIAIYMLEFVAIPFLGTVSQMGRFWSGTEDLDLIIEL